jgi:hypothetical protein
MGINFTDADKPLVRVFAEGDTQRLRITFREIYEKD